MMRSTVLSLVLLLSSVLLSVRGQTFQNTMAIFNPPTSIPNTGSYTAVVSWETNMKDLVNLHLDLSDITLAYAYDGGSTVQVQGPGAGTATLVLSLSYNGGALNIGDKYQLHTYMTNATISKATNYTNDWKYTAFDGYTAVTVGSAPLPNTMQLISVPSTIPNSGYFVGDVYWSSSIQGNMILHMDLGDVTQSYAYDGGAQWNVSAPGSGILKFNMSIQNGVTPGQPLSLGDTYDIHLYMATAANNSLYAGADWQHVTFERYYTATAAVGATLANTVTVVNPPSLIPPTGNITVALAWSSNITGVINLHLDISDITQAYAYDGGAMVQVNGPGAGLVYITTPISVTGAAADAYQLHSYMLDEVTSQKVASGASNNDWQYALYNGYYPVTQGIAAVVTYPNYLAIYQPPTTIPNTGIVTCVIEWSSNSAVSTNIHLDLSDITKAYAYDGGVTMTVPSPGNGWVTLSLPIIGSLSTGDFYQLHVYTTGYNNSQAYGSTNDWQHTNLDLYQPVVVSAAPLVNYMTLLNVPTTIPQTGSIQLEIFYSSNATNATYVHVDLSDVTMNWAYKTGSSVLVPTPGSGTVTLIIPFTAAMNLTIGDVFNLHGYLTSLANSQLYGSSNDWAHESFDSYNTVAVAKAATFPINLSPLNAPSTIPNAGNFSIVYKWSSNYTGEINLHVDLSDTSQNWLFEAGNTVTVTSPGSGIVTFFENLGTAVLPVGDSFDLHAYITPVSTSLMYGISNDWQHTIYDGFSVVSAANLSVLTNSLTFPSAPSLIPSSGSFTVTLAYTTNYTTGVNVHMDLSDVTQSWLFENGSTIVVPAGQTSGTLTFTLTLASGVALNAGDSYDLHAYMAPTINSNANGGAGNDWKISIADSFAPVTVSGIALTNSMTLLNPPTTIAIEGTQQFQVLWSASYSGLMNLHLDLSDVTQNYFYEGGAYAQVTGPGSGIAIMSLPMNVSMLTGDSYTLHAYMASSANSSLYGGTSSDWQHSAFDGFWTVKAGKLTSFSNNLTIINPPQSIPQSGTFAVQCAYSTNIEGMNLHLDLSDVTQSYAYDGGSTVTVYDAGSGVVTMSITISSTLPKADTYVLHAYMASVANATLYGGSGNDWQHTIYDGFYTVSAGSPTPTPSSSSSSGLSNGAIAGIVIGSVVGALLVLALCVFFVCMGKSGKKMTTSDGGAHSRHEDERSTVSASAPHPHSEMEMGETHSSA